MREKSENGVLNLDNMVEEIHGYLQYLKGCYVGGAVKKMKQLCSPVI